MSLQAVGLSKEKRHPNEDAFICMPDAKLFGVFDGVGGHGQGDIASHIIAKTFKNAAQHFSLVTNQEHTYISPWLTEVMHRAHEKVTNECDGSTTASLLAFNGASNNEALILSIGDSRVYGFRKSTQMLCLLTVDDTLHRDLRLDTVESHSQLTRSMETPFQYRNVINRCVGNCYLDVKASEVITLPTSNFDGFLLTTDGIHDNLSHREILNVLMNPANNSQTVAEALITAARDRSQNLAHIRHKVDDMTAIYVTLKPE